MTNSSPFESKESSLQSNGVNCILIVLPRCHPNTSTLHFLWLLRTVCQMTPPAAGWDASPHAADISRETDIARVRYFMNTVLDHAAQARVSDAVYVNYCENIREMLVRLGGAGYGDAMDKIMDRKMDPVTQEHYKELLMQWKKNEDCIKDKMNELENAMEASGDEGKFWFLTIAKHGVINTLLLNI